jgi:mannosyltransferase
VDLDADRDRGVRPDRDGRGDHQARVIAQSPASVRRPPIAAVRAASPPRPELIAVLVLTGLALILRVTSLSRGLFSDEAYSLAIAQRGFGHMFELFGYEANGTAYELAVWPLIRIFGDSALVLRLPSLIAGVATVPALWWAARRIASPAAALLAAGLIAVNPMAAWYSQTARAYALTVLATCLAFGALARAVDRPDGRRAWAGYVGAMTALAYCDLFAAPFLLPAQALLVRPQGRAGYRRWLSSLIAVVVLCVPLLVAAAISRSRRDPLYWLRKPDRGLISVTLQEFTGGFSGVTAVRWATLAAGALVLAGAVWLLRRERDERERNAFAVAACWGLLPIVLLLGISLVQPVFWPRYAIFALPGLCLLAAVAAVSLGRSRRGLALAAACLAVIAVAGVVADVRQRTKLQEDFQRAAAWLRSERAPGQPTIVDQILVLPTLGYYDPAFADRGDLVVPEWGDRKTPAGVVGYKDPRGYGGVPAGPPRVDDFARQARLGHGTVWMVLSEVDKTEQGDPRSGAAVAWARSHCQVQVRESVGVWVLRASGCRF